MRSFSTVFTALLLVGALAPGAHGTTRVAPAIGVFLDFEAQPSPQTVKAMEAEVASIMAPSGLIFSWQKLNGDQQEATFADLVIIHFKGSCNAGFAPLSELGPWTENGTALASTQVSNGQVLHFTDVNCNEVVHYLAAEAAHVKQAKRDELYGRALGRIVSHEMYHIFAGTEKHASDGVARAYFSRQQLIQPVFAFEPKESEALRDFRIRAFMATEADPEP